MPGAKSEHKGLRALGFMQRGVSARRALKFRVRGKWCQKLGLGKIEVLGHFRACGERCTIQLQVNVLEMCA